MTGTNTSALESLFYVPELKSGNWLHQAAATAAAVGIVIIAWASLKDGKETDGAEAKQDANQPDRT